MLNAFTINNIHNYEKISINSDSASHAGSVLM